MKILHAAPPYVRLVQATALASSVWLAGCSSNDAPSTFINTHPSVDAAVSRDGSAPDDAWSPCICVPFDDGGNDADVAVDAATYGDGGPPK